MLWSEPEVGVLANADLSGKSDVGPSPDVTPVVESGDLAGDGKQLAESEVDVLARIS